MKILSILTSFTVGGAEVLVSNLSNEFVRCGHHSIVAALSPAYAIGNRPETEAEMQSRIENGGGRTVQLGLMNRKNFLAGARTMRRLLKDEQPDIVHAHTARAVPMLWLAGIQVPLVLTHHNSRLPFPPSLFRFLDLVVDTYVAISVQCGELISAASRGPIAHIANGTGPEFLATSGRARINRPAALLAVGALTEQKNYKLMIEAAVKVRKRRPDLPFVLSIAGDGKLRREASDAIEALDAQEYIKLLGDRSDVSSLMQKADLFLNSSHYEGLPVAMIEALQSALPVVATKVAGTVELVRDGENGFLVPPNDPEAFAEALHLALDCSPGTYAALSNNALKEGRKYLIGNCASQHLDMYQRLAGGVGRPSEVRAA